jgi:chromosome segregation ATPase
MSDAQPTIFGVQNYYSSASQLTNSTEPEWLRYVEANKEHIEALWTNFHQLDRKVDAGERRHHSEVRHVDYEVGHLRDEVQYLEGRWQVAMNAVSASLEDIGHGVQEIKNVRSDLVECRQSLVETDKETARCVDQLSGKIATLERGIDHYGLRIREQNDSEMVLVEKVDNRLKPLEQNVERILKALEKSTLDEAPAKDEEKPTVEYIENIVAVPTVSAPSINAQATSTAFAETMNSLLATVQKLQDDSAADREKSQTRMLALEEQVRILTTENAEYKERGEGMQAEIDNLKARLEPTPGSSCQASSLDLPSPLNLSDRDEEDRQY